MYSAECPPTERIYGVDYRQLSKLSHEPAAAVDDIQIPPTVVERIDTASAPLMRGPVSDTADSVQSTRSTSTAATSTAAAPAAAPLHCHRPRALLQPSSTSPPSTLTPPPPSREPTPVAPAAWSTFVPYATRTGRKFSIMRLDPQKIPDLCRYCSALRSYCICSILPSAPDYQPDETEQDRWYPGKPSADDDQK